MKAYYLQFTTKDEWDDLESSMPTDATLDVVGVRYETVNDVSVPIAGWHVNVLIGELPSVFEPFTVTPETPWRQFNDFEVPKTRVVEVTMGQCRLALFDLKNIKSDEEFYALTDLLPEEDRPRAVLELRTRNTVRIDHPLVQALAGVNGWDLDALFEYADKL